MVSRAEQRRMRQAQKRIAWRMAVRSVPEGQLFTHEGKTYRRTGDIRAEPYRATPSPNGPIAAQAFVPRGAEVSVVEVPGGCQLIVDEVFDDTPVSSRVLTPRKIVRAPREVIPYEKPIVIKTPVMLSCPTCNTPPGKCCGCSCDIPSDEQVLDPDPYGYELYNDESLHLLCSQCSSDRHDDV